MKKTNNIELTKYEIETLEKAKDILVKVSPTDIFYVEFWKDMNFMRLNPCGDDNARGITFNFFSEPLQSQVKEMYSRNERSALRSGSEREERSDERI